MNLLVSSITFCLHITVSEYSLARYNDIKPVFAANRLSSFTHLDFSTRLSRKFRNGAKSHWKSMHSLLFLYFTFIYVLIHSFLSLFSLFTVKRLTSFHVFSEIIPFRIGYKIFRSGFLGAVVQLTNVLGKDVVKALTSDVTMTFP